MNKTNGNHLQMKKPVVDPVAQNQSLKTYHIFHAINKLYVNTEKLEQPRRYVGWVLATDLDDAYIKSQKDFNPDYKRYGARDTCVGDVIQDDQAIYLIINSGFYKISDLEDREHQSGK
jgi:hypothetical protein